MGTSLLRSFILGNKKKSAGVTLLGCVSSGNPRYTERCGWEHCRNAAVRWRLYPCDSRRPFFFICRSLLHSRKSRLCALKKNRVCFAHVPKVQPQLSQFRVQLGTQLALSVCANCCRHIFVIFNG